MDRRGGVGPGPAQVSPSGRCLLLAGLGRVAKYDRLRQLKATHEPDNLFRLNQNIPPA